MSDKGAARIDDLVAAYESWARQADAFFDPDIVGMLLEYRSDYVDKNLTRWGSGDLVSLLLGIFPRKVLLDDDEIGDVVPAVRTFVEFLAATGRLSKSSDPLDHLREDLDEIEGAFEEAMADPGAFGIAKQVALAMGTDGVDVSDPAAVQSWVEAFNARPEAERRALISPPVSLPSRLNLPADIPLPMVAVPPADDLARALRAAPLWQRLVAFVGWVGPGRKLTDSGRIKLRDVPELVEVLGLKPLPAGQKPRSSSDLPELEWTCTLAGAALLVEDTGRDLVTTELGRTLGEAPLESLASVLDGLLLTGAVTWLRGAKAWQPPWAPGLDRNLPDLLVLSYLAREEGIPAEEIAEVTWQAVDRELGDVAATMGEGLAADVRALIGILADFGLAQRSADRLVLTPLGIWAVNGLLREEGYDAPAFTDGPEADIADRLAYWGGLDFEGEELPRSVDAWLAGTTPAAAIPALVRAAGPEVGLRGMFLYVLERMGPAYADAIREARAGSDPALRPYFAAWAADRDPDGQEPSEEDLAHIMADQLTVLLVQDSPEALVAMLEELGPAREQAEFLQTLAGLESPGIDLILQAVAASHPDPAVARAARKASLSPAPPRAGAARQAARPRSGRGRSARARKKSRGR